MRLSPPPPTRCTPRGSGGSIGNLHKTQNEGEERFKVQLEGNMNVQPARRYCLSRSAHAVGLCATCFWHTMSSASNDATEALAQRLEQYLATYHTATLAIVVFVAHAPEASVPSPSGPSQRAGSSRRSIAALCGSTWRAFAAMLPLRTAKVLCYPQLQMETHGSVPRCSVQCGHSALAPAPRCLTFHPLRSQQLSLKILEISIPLPILFDEIVSHMCWGGLTLFCRGGCLLVSCTSCTTILNPPPKPDLCALP